MIRILSASWENRISKSSFKGRMEISRRWRWSSMRSPRSSRPHRVFLSQETSPLSTFRNLIQGLRRAGSPGHRSSRRPLNTKPNKRGVEIHLRIDPRYSTVRFDPPTPSQSGQSNQRPPLVGPRASFHCTRYPVNISISPLSMRTGNHTPNLIHRAVQNLPHVRV
jgi:hypothetical protein